AIVDVYPAEIWSGNSSNQTALGNLLPQVFPVLVLLGDKQRRFVLRDEFQQLRHQIAFTPSVHLCVQDNHRWLAFHRLNASTNQRRKIAPLRDRICPVENHPRLRADWRAIKQWRANTGPQLVVVELATKTFILRCGENDEVLTECE